MIMHKHVPALWFRRKSTFGNKKNSFFVIISCRRGVVHTALCDARLREHNASAEEFFFNRRLFNEIVIEA